jgi:N-acetylglucosaminyl-diphospho-decaprenol L-rhamnosyltransferase
VSHPLTVLIVSHDSGPLLERCIASLGRDPFTADAPVIIVDNASAEDSARRTAARYPRVRLIELADNRGFGAGNDAGLAVCETPFVLMANPDTEVAGGSAEELVLHLAERPHAGLVGCRLVEPDGTVLATVRNLPTVLREAVECVFLHRVLPGRAERFAESVQDRGAYEAPRDAGWVSGAAMLGRVEALRDVGGFDEDFFLYAEEIDLCRRLRDAGWEVRYDPALTMLHVGGAYTTDPDLALENQRSKLRYFLKHEGRGRMLAFAAVIVVRLALRGALWAVAGIVRRDEKLRKRARAAFATLRRYPALVAGFARMPRPAPRISGPLPGREPA